MSDSKIKNGLRSILTPRPILKSVNKVQNDDHIKPYYPDTPDCSVTRKLFPAASSTKQVYIDFPGHKAAELGEFDDLRQVLNSPNFNLFRQDYKNERTVLHYATAYGNQEVALKMANLILDSEHFKKPENVKEKENLINVRDKQGETALHLAAKNRHRKVVQLLIFSSADVNLKCNEGIEPIELIYEHVPQVMIAVFDKAIRCGKTGNREIYEDNFEVSLHFEAIIGYPDEKDFQKHLAGESEIETNLLINALNGNEKKCGEVLIHPLVQLFLREKWRKIRGLFLSSILFHMVWLVIFSVFVLNLYVYKCPYLPKATGNDTGIRRSDNNLTIGSKSENSSDIDNALLCYPNLGNINFISLILTITLTVIVGFKELYEMSSLPNIKNYITNLENIGQITQIVLIIITTWPVLYGGGTGGSILIFQYHYQSAAFGVLLAWTLILCQIGKAPQLGIYVEILKKVLKSFGMFMITFISLLAGFAFAFSIIMPKMETFRPHLAFPKLLVMMVGELNYDETFYNEETGGVPFLFSGHVIFASFTIIVTIILFNLLIGLTVNDIQGLQNKAQVSRLSNQLEQIYLMESFLFSKNMQKITRFLRLHKTFQKNFLIVPPTPPTMQSLRNQRNGRTETDRSVNRRSSIEKLETVVISSEDQPDTDTDRDCEDSIVVKSILARGSVDETESAGVKESTVVVMPIKNIPKHLVKEVRKLAAMNMNPNSSLSETELITNCVSEVDEMRIQFKNVQEKLDQILSYISNQESSKMQPNE